MKILLTGANGFTGLHFSKIAQCAGHEVVTLRADLTDRASVLHEVRAASPELVVHLAAISFVGHTEINEFYAVNVVGSMNLLAALDSLKTQPSKVLLISSANVYGTSNCPPLTEIHTPKPISHYGMSKLAMEYMARPFTERLPLVIARTFNYTGPGQSVDFVIAKLAHHFARRAPTIALGNLDVEREVNDVEVICDLYLKLLQFGKAGETYNVCSGQPYPLGHVIDTLTSLSGHKLNVEVNPIFVRTNEVQSLYGNPAKLEALLAQHGAVAHVQTLGNTLQRMLMAAEGTHNARS